MAPRRDRSVHGANGHGYDGRDRSSDEIVRDLEATRRDIGRTLTELERRLTPGELFEQAVEHFRRTGAPEFTQNLGRGVRENPMPVVLTAVGLGWLMWSASHPRPPRAASGQGSGSGRAREALGSAAETGRRALERAGHAREVASERSAAMADRARRASGGLRDGARRAGSGAKRALHEQPMTLGLAAFALASLVAALLPPSEVEDEVMGETRDDALRSAAERGAEGAERAADTLETKASEAAEALRERAERYAPSRQA